MIREVQIRRAVLSRTCPSLPEVFRSCALLLLVAGLAASTGLLGAQAKRSGPPAASSASKGQPSPAFERLSKQAAAAREANQGREAIRLYLEALRLNPKWGEGWWYVGTLYYDSDQYAEGAKAFHNLVQILPNYGDGWAMLGLCEFELRDYKNSFLHIQEGRAKGLGDNQDLVNVARYHQALVEILNGDFEGATALLSSLVTQNVLSNDVKLAMGLALLRVPLLPNQVDPSKDALVSAAGNIGELQALNDFDAAKKAFAQLVRDYPTAPFVHYAYASMLSELSLYQEAEKQLEEEIKINPDSAIAYMQLAYVYIRVNRYKDALDPSRRAAKMAPDSFAAHYVLGRALLGTGQVSEAIDELRIAKRLAPYSPDVRYNLSRALARAKRPQEAAQEQAEFERLSALVEKAQKESGPASYRESHQPAGPASQGGQEAPDHPPHP